MIRSVRIARGKMTLLSAALLAAAVLALPAMAHAQTAWGAQDPGSAAGTMLTSVASVGAMQAWAVGDVGTVMHTGDGGVTWTAQTSGLSDNVLCAVAFTDATHGWAVGDEGTIISTINGGAKWTLRSSGVTDGSGLYGVSFPNATHGWAVGDSGLIVHSTNGGTSWSAQKSGIDDGTGLRAVDFVNSSDGWAVGDNGTIISTINGGSTWTAQDSGVYDGSALYAVFFVDADNGWAVGDAGLIVATNDGGATWMPQDSGIADDSGLYGITFIDADNGWAVGDAGLVVATDDGGQTWTAQDSGDTQDGLRSVVFADDDHGWAVGDNGAIYAYGVASVSAPVSDTTPPVTRMLTDPALAGGWSDGPVMVDLEARDNFGGSGVDATYYALEGSDQTYDSPFEIAAEGVHTVRYHSVDASGNVEADKSAMIGIDLTAPDLSLDAVGSYDGSATVKATTSDDLSGVGSVQMSLDGGAWKTADQISTSAPGTHTLDCRAFDVAGNESDASATFTVVWPRLVATSTSLKTPASVKVNKTLILAGTVSPLGAPGTVTIVKTRLVGRTWRSAGTATVKVVNGSFTYSFKLGKRGNYRFTARYSGRVVGLTTCRASKSATRTVKVK
jgi:photosystem II stability/assembly factor-like uncharacterized protein